MEVNNYWRFWSYPSEEENSDVSSEGREQELSDNEHTVLRIGATTNSKSALERLLRANKIVSCVVP